MIDTTSLGMIQTSVVEAKWRSDIERRQESDNRLDLYSDDYKDIILAELAEQHCPEVRALLSRHVNQSQNILKRIINEVSMVYKVPATRGMAKADSPRYEEIKELLGLDVKMKRVNRYVNLMNETLVKIGVRDGQLVYDILTPNICGVVQNADDPTKADTIWYVVWLTNTMGLQSTECEYYVYESNGEAYVLDTSMRLKKTIYGPDDNPFFYESGPDKGKSFIPIVTLHRQEPDFTFWDQDSGRDLYNAAVGVGCKMTLMDYYFHNASHKQIFMIGPSSSTMPDRQIMDPRTVLRGISGPDGTTTIGTLDVQNRMPELIEGVKYHVNSIITTYGISPDSWNMSGSEVSGRALKIRSRALLEAREDQIPTYRSGEKELFEKTRAINNNLAKSMGWEKIPDGDFAIDFGEVEFPESPEVELAFMEQKLKAGLVSLGQFYAWANPDVADEAQAEEMIIDNLNKMADLRKANPSLDEALNAIFTSQKTVTPAAQGDQGGAVQ